MEEDTRNQRQREKNFIDPIVQLLAPSAVNSVCFVGNIGVCKDTNQRSDSDSDNDDDDDSDDDLIPQFRSTDLSRNNRHYSILQESNDNGTSRFGNYLVSSQRDTGEALLWDIKRQQIHTTISPYRGGPGLSVRRIEGCGHDNNGNNQIAFQTRDPKGVVSIHQLEEQSSSSSSSGIVQQYETYCRTFCQAAPCYGDSNLMVLPCSDESQVTVVDHRSKSPIATYKISNHGMVTSLAMISSSSSSSSRPTVLCGMESGSVASFHVEEGFSSSSTVVEPSYYSIGKEPILSLDVVPSTTISSDDESTRSAMLIAAGLAGDAAEVAELNESDRGRCVVFKAIHASNGDGQSRRNDFTYQPRARLSTCRVDDSTSGGKPGVNVCRFRPNDGRILAIGGWDYRVRLFERASDRRKGFPPLAILRNGGSVSALDWAPNADTSGLLASASNRTISIWQCYPSTPSPQPSS